MYNIKHHVYYTEQSDWIRRHVLRDYKSFFKS